MDESRQFRCPSCGASTRPTHPVTEGQPLRCGRCGTALRVGEPGDVEAMAKPVRGPRPGRETGYGDDDASTRDRKGMRKDKANTGPRLLILGIGGAVLLLACVVVGVIVMLTLSKGGDSGRPGSRVTAADLRKLEIFMTKGQVEAALGEGKPANLRDLHPNWLQAGQRTGATAWYQWGGGDDALYVGFGRGGSGTQRAVISLFVHKSARGNVVGEETKPGFMNLDPFGADLDDLARDQEKANALLKNPKWKTGPEVRKALVGFWVAVGVGSYDFKADGTCRSQGSGDKSGGTYEFTDDEHIEMTLKAEPAFAGQQTEAKKLRYKVLVGQKELILIDDRFPGAHPIVYQRSK
jgi:hypothetical protein